MTALLLLTAAFFAATAISAAPMWNRTNLVETRVGSGGAGWGIGQLNPGPQVPFGAMRLGPDTSIGLEPLRLTFDDFSGYYYFNNHIECLSHTHVVGAGEGDFQNFGVTVTRSFTNEIIQNCNYRSLFTHTEEVAKPGYYAVNLLTPNVYAEVAVSGTHAGMHRYTARSVFPQQDNARSYLLIDVCHGVTRNIGDFKVNESCLQGQVTNVTPTTQDPNSIEVDAWIFNKGDFSQSSNRGGIHIYFTAVVSAFRVNPDTGARTPTPVVYYGWEGGVVGDWTANVTTTGSLGVAFTPAGSINSTDVIAYELRVGISFVSIANAKQNLATQGAASFDDAVQSTINEWEAHQATISYSGGAAASDTHRAAFETALYHTALPPTTYSEWNGDYLGEDWQVHTAPAGRRYLSDLSIWDIYRTQAPLLLLIKPTVAADLANSMMDMYGETGLLPVWVLGNVEADCMVGHHSAVIFADYVMKGLPNINTTAILNAVVGQIGVQNTQNLAQYGFVPMESSQQGSSVTQDYSIDAGAAANLAEFLNDTAAATLLRRYAESYKNTFDNSSSYFCPRYANGTFACIEPYLPYPLNNAYIEGNAAQYRWYVPHDLEGLMGLFPNRTYYVDQLAEFFSLSQLWIFNTTFPNPAYWAGNEPDILAPFLFLFAGNEYAFLTSQWVPTLLETYYFPYASGIPGNDDYGTMSSWVVYAYLGLYPVASTDQYGLFAPMFDDIDIALDARELAASPWSAVVRPNATGARTSIIRIRTTGRPASGTAYVASISLNGRVLSTPVVRHRDLLALGSDPFTLIEFTLTAEACVFGAPAPSAGGPPVYVPSSAKWGDEERDACKAKFAEYGAALSELNKNGKLFSSSKFYSKK